MTATQTIEKPARKISAKATAQNVAVTSDAAYSPPAVADADDRMMTMLQNIIANPEIAIKRVDQAFTLYEKIEASRARKAFDAAFGRMQSAIPVITRNGEISTNEKDDKGNKTGKQKGMAKYAYFADIMEAVQPILEAEGFGLSFRIAQPTPDRVSVTCVLAHSAGHREETTFALPIDTSGAKNNVQGWGSSLAYAKRYTASAMLNIVSRESTKDDDDGKAAGLPSDALATISEAQAAELEKLIADAGSNPSKFLAIANAESIGDVLAKDFEGLKLVLSAKKKNGAGQ